jgi:hypothetical protein
MQPPCLGACGGSLAVLGPIHRPSTSRATVRCAARGGGRGKENVWSVDNERAAEQKARPQKTHRGRGRGRRSPGGRGRPPPPPGRRKEDDADPRVLVSGAMLVEVETVLQTQVHWYYHCLTSASS